MCAALRELVESDGALPARGSLPDMAADTTSFVTLQQLYQKQSQLQCESVYRRATQLARSLGQSQDFIIESEVSTSLIIPLLDKTVFFSLGEIDL